MAPQAIPDIVIGRLPIYLRALQRMEQSGQQVTSSQELAIYWVFRLPKSEKTFRNLENLANKALATTLNTSQNNFKKF